MLWYNLLIFIFFFGLNWYWYLKVWLVVGGMNLEELRIELLRKKEDMVGLY